MPDDAMHTGGTRQTLLRRVPVGRHHTARRSAETRTRPKCRKPAEVRLRPYARPLSQGGGTHTSQTHLSQLGRTRRTRGRTLSLGSCHQCRNRQRGMSPAYGIYDCRTETVCRSQRQPWRGMGKELCWRFPTERKAVVNIPQGRLRAVFRFVGTIL